MGISVPTTTRTATPTSVATTATTRDSVATTTATAKSVATTTAATEGVATTTATTESFAATVVSTTTFCRWQNFLFRDASTWQLQYAASWLPQWKQFASTAAVSAATATALNDSSGGNDGSTATKEVFHAKRRLLSSHLRLRCPR